MHTFLSKSSYFEDDHEKQIKILKQKNKKKQKKVVAIHLTGFLMNYTIATFVQGNIDEKNPPGA